MRRILYVHSSLGIGGAQSVRYMFLKNLNSNSFKITVCCLKSKGDFGKKIEDLGYKVDVLNGSDGLISFFTTLRLYRYLKKNKFDIVHSSLFHANYHSALSAKLAGVDCLIIEEHGEHNLHLKRRHIFYRLIGRLIAACSRLVICCSDFVRNGVRDAYGVDRNKLIVIRNLVEDKKQEVDCPRNEMRQRLSIPRQAVVIGTVSSLYWIKNQRVLIDILGRLSDNNVFLVIAGDGPMRRELLAYAEKLGTERRVRILGWRYDIANILNALDIFVLPSLSEGLPICLLEAMSMGLPCIAAKVGGIGELLSDGVTGLLVRPDDIDDLDSKLRHLMGNRNVMKKMGIVASAYVSKYFNTRHYVNRIIDLYDQLLGNSKQLHKNG